MRHLNHFKDSLNLDLVFGTIYPALCAKLSDENDDVVSAAAAAILPIVTKISANNHVKVEPGNNWWLTDAFVHSRSAYLFKRQMKYQLKLIAVVHISTEDLKPYNNPNVLLTRVLKVQMLI